jgi:hypothetical protein
MARHPRFAAAVVDEVNPIVAAYIRAADDAPAKLQVPDSSGSVEIAGVLSAASAPSGADDGNEKMEGRLISFRAFMDELRDRYRASHAARMHEVAFLANALATGCSLLSRPFTEQEAFDAAVATCNLGLDLWPSGAPLPGSLVAPFEMGWSMLLRDVSQRVAARLSDVLVGVHSDEAATEEGLDELRRQLLKHRRLGTPWLVHDALDVLAGLDTPAWNSLLGLLSECPVVPASTVAIVKRQTTPIDPNAFTFVSSREELELIGRFLDQLSLAAE